MTTKMLTEQDIATAAMAIKTGQLVAFPTETVYGLGANALDETAVKKVYQAKGRPSDNPLIVHVSSVEMLRNYVKKLSEAALKLITTFWPGPLTLIFSIEPDTFPSVVTGGLSTAAFRMPDNQCTLRLIEAAGVPIVGPSANTSGRPSPTTAQHVAHDLQGKIAFILDDGPTKIGVESTVLDLSEPEQGPVILRPGAITQAQLAAVINEVTVDQHLVGAAETPKAPGMKYKHYSPEATVWIVPEVSNEKWQAAVAFGRQQQQKIGLLLPEFLAKEMIDEDVLVVSYGANTVENATKALFAGLRNLDEQGADLIFVQGLPEEGLGIAYMNRLKKAANRNIFN